MLVHLTRPPLQPSDRPPLLLLLHGLGSNEADLFALAPELDERFFVVSVRAPLVLGPSAFAWFHVDFTPNGIVVDPRQAEASRETLIELVDQLVETYRVDPTRVYFMGFSQGAIMSAAVALTRADKLAGAVLMSGRVMPEMLPPTSDRAGLAGLPIMVAHGLYDDTLPIAYGRASRDLLSSLPVDLTYREYPMAHQVSIQSLADVTAWLRARLDTPPRI